MKREFEVKIPDNYILGNPLVFDMGQEIIDFTPFIIDGLLISKSQKSKNKIVMIKYNPDVNWPIAVNINGFANIKIKSYGIPSFKKISDNVKIFDPIEQNFKTNYFYMIFPIVFLVLFLMFRKKIKFYLQKSEMRKKILCYLDTRDEFSVYLVIKNENCPIVNAIVGEKFRNYFLDECFKKKKNESFFQECIRLL